MDKFIYGFIKDKLIPAIFTALIISIAFMFLGYRSALDYVFGFLIGCTNFIGLSLGSDYLLSGRPQRAGIIHFIFFTFRYAVVAYLIASMAINRGGSPLIIVFGFLTLNLSIRYSAFKEYLISKKEG